MEGKENIDDELLQLLQEFDLEIIYEKLNSAGVTFRCLQYLQSEDIEKVLEHVGHRVEFREKLKEWKKNKFGLEEENPSGNFQTPNSSLGGSLRIKPLASLLNGCEKGKSILNAYATNGVLDNTTRTILTHLIIEDVIYRGIKLYQQDFIEIVKEITTLFPNENKLPVSYF